MKRFILALVALLLVAEAAHAFRTPSVRTRNRASNEPPAAVRMPDNARPADPAKADITIEEGQPAPAITVSPPAKPEPPEPAVAVPSPPTPKPEPVAIPIPAVPAPKPEPVAAPVPPPPVPKPAVVAAPAPIVVVPPVVVPPVVVPPVVVPPVVVPPVVVPPVAAPAPAAEERKPIVVLPKPTPAVVAAAVASKPPVAAGRPDPRLIENIFACLSPGLPNDWKKAWIVLAEPGPDRKPNAKFFFSISAADGKGETFVPCNAHAVADSVYSLNELLTPEQRRWSSARLLITSDGAFELNYDYPK